MKTSTRRKYPAIVAIASIALLAGLVAPAGSGTIQSAPTGEDLGHVRFQESQVFSKRWVATGGPHGSVRQILFDDEIATPESAAAVDIVATVTINHRTSRRDRGGLLFRYSLSGQSLKAMSPGQFPYSSPHPSVNTTSTFVWTAKSVEAAGESYHFRAETGAVDANKDGKARVSGKKITVVIEMWPSE